MALVVVEPLGNPQVATQEGVGMDSGEEGMVVFVEGKMEWGVVVNASKNFLINSGINEQEKEVQ